MIWDISVMSETSYTFNTFSKEYGTIYAIYPEGSDYVKSTQISNRSKKSINIDLYTRRSNRMQFRILHSRHRAIVIENNRRSAIGTDYYISDAYFKRPKSNIRNRMHMYGSDVYSYRRRR